MIKWGSGPGGKMIFLEQGNLISHKFKGLFNFLLPCSYTVDTSLYLEFTLVGNFSHVMEEKEKIRGWNM